MKKLLCAVFTTLMLTGCGSSSQTKITTCTLKDDTNGVKADFKVTLENDGKTITKQTQSSVITVSDDATFQAIATSLKSMNFTEKSKEMKGVSYKLVEDKDKKTISEDVTIDITKVSGKDYSIMTNGQVNVTTEKIKVVLDDTVEKFEAQGLICKVDK